MLFFANADNLIFITFPIKGCKISVTPPRHQRVPDFFHPIRGFLISPRNQGVPDLFRLPPQRVPDTPIRVFLIYIAYLLRGFLIYFAYPLGGFLIYFAYPLRGFLIPQSECS